MGGKSTPFTQANWIETERFQITRGSSTRCQFRRLVYLIIADASSGNRVCLGADLQTDGVMSNNQMQSNLNRIRRRDVGNESWNTKSDVKCE